MFGNSLALLRSLEIWDFSIGGFGIGMRSLPWEALRVHHMLGSTRVEYDLV